GQHLVEVRAYNTAGGESEPASIILIVAHVVAEATPTVALGPSFETPTPTTPPPSATATLTPPPGATPTSTAGSPTATPTSPPPTATASPIPPTATPTQTTTPVPTDTPTATPTLPVLLTPPPTVVPPSFPEITIDLDQANSGAVDKDGQLYYYIAQPGDTWTNKRVKGFLSWDLSAIPGGAQILSARIAWSTECSHGASSGDCTGYRDIFQALGRLWVRAYFYDRLDVGDFASAGLQGGTLLTSYTAQPTGNLDVTQAVADAYAADRPFQVYTLFAHATDNDGLHHVLRFPWGLGANALTVVYAP
ncbi:MAG: hypothetical protein WBH57_03580, partial [Anaerolineae bacterium]